MISIIIPVFNAEKYLKKCLESICNQTYTDIEIILINDGSVDGSLEICYEYAQKDARVRVFSIKNSGPYQARKYGVNVASGEYVSFVDADDWLEVNTYDETVRICDNYHPDIIMYSFQLDNDGKARECYYDEGLYQRRNIERDIIPNMLYDFETGTRKINPSLCCKLIKRELFLEVVKGVHIRLDWGDDAAVTYPSIVLAESIYIYNTPFYHYRKNDLSSTHTYTLGRIEEIQNFSQVIRSQLAKFKGDFDFNPVIDCYIRIFINMLLSSWFGIYRSGIVFLFPYLQVPANSKIQIYGAGEVGKSYVMELEQSSYAEIVGWYDKNICGTYWLNREILHPNDILKTESDMVLIAVTDDTVAGEIRKQLVKMGIDNNKIIWEKPVLRA